MALIDKLNKQNETSCLECGQTNCMCMNPVNYETSTLSMDVMTEKLGTDLYDTFNGVKEACFAKVMYFNTNDHSNDIRHIITKLSNPYNVETLVDVMNLTCDLFRHIPEYQSMAVLREFKVAADYRNNGIGTIFMQQLKQFIDMEMRVNLMIVNVESVDLPPGDVRKRYIQFLKGFFIRNGFRPLYHGYLVRVRNLEEIKINYKLPFSNVYMQWAKEVKEKMPKSSYENMINVFETEILPIIGDYTLKEIDESVATQAIEQWGAESKSVENYAALVMEFGINRGYTPLNKNPFEVYYSI